jgi:hypothetical protein
MPENAREKSSAYMSSNTLYINGERTNLRHIEDLRQVASDSQALISSALTYYFPVKIKALSKEAALPDDYVDAAESYGAEVLQFMFDGDPAVGMRVLQWCALLTLVASLRDDLRPNMEVRDGVRLASFIAGTGAIALSITEDLWNAAQKYSRLRSRRQFMSADHGLLEPVVIPPKATVRLPFVGPYVGGKDAEMIVSVLIKKGVASDLLVEDGCSVLTTTVACVELAGDFGLGLQCRRALDDQHSDRNIALMLSGETVNCRVKINKGAAGGDIFDARFIRPARNHFSAMVASLM